MESPGAYPESPLDPDDVVYPCKNCGEILEEGKAFELAGNRWHIDCFRCNTCGTLLDSDANLLLLGDGSLICNNCTYSCNHCGNKIEDLAILTGDQAFCANCFRCRNCKRKIENLRYARTSQGIFCMSCHESLMARRRKKSKKAPPASTGAIFDKSLPALPPSALPSSTFTPDMDTPSSEQYSEPPTTDTSPRPRGSSMRKDSSPGTFRRDASPASLEAPKGTTLPASTYKDPKQADPSDNGDDGILLPFALDPTVVPGPSPLGQSRKFNEGPVEAGHTRGQDSKTGRDYFNRPSNTSHRDMLKENRPGSSRSASTERDRPSAKPSPAAASPHIAYQEKGRATSDNLVESVRKRKEPMPPPSSTASPIIGNDRSRTQMASPQTASSSQSDAFKLQEVPKNKKTASRSGSRSELRSSLQNSPAVDAAGRTLSPQLEGSSLSSSPVATDSRAREESTSSQASSYSSTQKVVERPKREDSLKPGLARKDAPSKSSPSTPTAPAHERKISAGGVRSQMNGGYTISSPIESPTSKSILNTPDPPSRSADRPGAGQTGDNFTSPRAPPAPPPPPPHQHRMNDSVSTVQSDHTHGFASAGLPRYSTQGDFSMDEDLARLLMSQEHGDKDPSVLRRVGSRVSAGGHKKWPANGSIDLISSPTMPSPDSKEENSNLRNELRRAQQRIAELEAEKNDLRETVNNASDLKQANTMLREKRNTMAVLDTQREMVIRELEIMTDHLKKAKDNNQSLDIKELKSDILRDFGASLQKLKDQLGGQIEELITRRTDLTNEISNLIQMKDKGFQEYESLSAQNTKLSNMNRDLIETIQRSLKENKHHNGSNSIDGGRPANGLGIYHAQQKGKPDLSMDLHAITHEHSYSNLIQEADAEATMVSAPQVVNIRKGKPNKFNWKKGGQGLAKNVTKGIKGAFASENRREDQYNINVIGTPYGSIPPSSDTSSMASAARTRDEAARNEAARGWFSQKGAPGKPDRLQKTSQNNNSNTNLAGEHSSVLFGSDLTARCDFEKRVIPSIVTRCIEEVELRGMDAEGIYRKSGGSGQVNIVRGGFEKSPDYDISDPDLDIHAVTSCLKQYFRRLPVPLITYDVYDQFLEAGQMQDTQEKANSILAAVNELPRAHRDCLQFLVFHLSRVIQHEMENLMTPLNLAVVFAPTIMRPMTLEREMTDVQQQRVAVQALLENHKFVFSED
ncbi:RhoGAP-domain-containing protein [Mytilinidion resinicola]|uniref:RhoGAP-domain-containing protein n=1 Tax=Mytilinidion resinicola TaxID=574789 RepID=A0A6A6Z983_9PEZI|nr:RhoGAP-domain-containing protein [Mytilinidion resinicola]KAF2817293.1 RhoGAP-domain-containing protein [Mytilinidion resinicola]